MRLLALKGRTYPSDLNPAGTAFGGWVMSKMDKAAGIAIDDIIVSKMVTVAVEVKNHKTNREYTVTEADFKFVAMSDNWEPIEVRAVLRDEIPEYVREMALQKP